MSGRLPPKSDAARLVALSEYTGDNLPAAVRNEIRSYEAALANTPAAVKARAKAERDLDRAKMVWKKSLSLFREMGSPIADRVQGWLNNLKQPAEK